MVAICKKKVTLTLNRPAYVSMCLSDLSRILKYKIHYDYIKNKFGNSSRWLFTDTDRLMWEIKMEGVYEDFSEDKELFDFSNFCACSKFHDDLNNLAVGKVKEKIGAVAIKEFFELKPKIYSFLVDGSSEYKKQMV